MTNNQYPQLNNKCTIEKCLQCPLKNTCRHYIEHLENRVLNGNVQTNPIQNSNIDVSKLLSHIDSLTTRVNELTTIVVNTSNTQQTTPQSDSQIISQSYSNDVLQNTNTYTTDVESQIDMQTTQVEHLQVNNNINENKSQDVEVVHQDNVENDLVIYKSESPQKVWVEKTNIFGQKTGKFKEIKVK